MRLRYITCSDPRENLNPKDVIDLLKISPLAELGVQAHPSAMSFGCPRFDWLKKLLDMAKDLQTPINLALHVNYKWCDKICMGKIPGEIKFFLNKRHSITHKPLIARIQLNIGDGTYEFYPQNLSNVICGMQQDYEFIFPFNNRVKKRIELLPRKSKFNLLFDGSYGAGIPPEKWEKPAYDNRQFGYAGGLSPDNVYENLNKISNILPKDYETWIDAEGQLRDIYTGSFNLDLARNYLTNAIEWNNQNCK